MPSWVAWSRKASCDCCSWSEASGVRLGVNQQVHECVLGALLVQGLFLLEREKSLGPQDQQIAVESNWLWNNSSPFGKQKNVHFWTVDSLASRWPWPVTWTSFLWLSVCLPILLRSSRIYIPPTSHIHSRWPLGWLNLHFDKIPRWLYAHQSGRSTGWACL